jgi:hypothetical protein
MKARSLVLFGLFAVTTQLVAGAAAVQPADPVAALEWLAGRWTGERDGTTYEEVWLAPKGGVMLGVHRETAGGKATFFEFLRIEAGSGIMVYHASPGGDTSTPFRVTGVRYREVTFSNPGHDFPTKIKYWLESDGRLHAWAEGTEKGAKRTEEWVWEKESEKTEPAK